MDFLGETTTLKDKVPKNKNKADLSKKIVYFSRDVDDYTAPRPLETGNTDFRNDRRSAFEDYMVDPLAKKEIVASPYVYEAPKQYVDHYQPYRDQPKE